MKKEIPFTELHVRHPEREKAIRRLKSVEGQVRGLQRMLEEDRYCVEILTLIASAQEALRATSKLILRNYLENCATNNIVSGDQDKKERTYDELMDMMYKYIRLGLEEVLKWQKIWRKNDLHLLWKACIAPPALWQSKKRKNAGMELLMPILPLRLKNWK